MPSLSKNQRRFGAALAAFLVLPLATMLYLVLAFQGGAAQYRPYMGVRIRRFRQD